jgi:hypothetical protein
MVAGVTERLGVPPETEILTIDTEEVEAFFHPTSRTIVFSRGFARYLLERGLPLSEDHVAAVLGHELEHAHVIGDDYIKRVKSGYLERLKASQNHAEEYRADAEAMSRLSRAGYNPQAVVEMLKAFSLTHGRSDLGHPEQIDRIRKLEDRLADDEHPLSHTTKELTPINAELLTWFSGNSEVYDRTEQLIHSSPQDLEQKVLESETQDEFWTAYEVEQHAERVGAAKEILSQNPEAVDNLFKKLMIIRALGSQSLFLDGKAIERGKEIGDIWLAEFFKYKDGPGGGYVLSGAIGRVDAEAVQKLSPASRFRDLIDTYNPGQATIDSALDALKDLDQRVEAVINTIFDRISGVDLSEEQQQFIQQLKQCLSSNTVNDDVFLTVFYNVDQNSQNMRYQESVVKSQSRGLRAPEHSSESLYDLSNPSVRESIVGMLKTGIALSMIENMPNPNSATVEHLATVISRDTHLPSEASQVLSQIMLFGEEGQPWKDYLDSLDRSQLPEIIKSIQLLTDGSNSLRMSPLRRLHQSYSASESSIYWRKPFAGGGTFHIDASGITLLKMLPGNNLLKRGYPPDYSEGWGSPPLENINLALNEWNVVVEGQGSHGAWSMRDIWVLKQYTSKLTQGLPVEDDLQKSASEVTYLNATTSLNAEELSILMDHSPWDTQTLLRRLTGITKLPHNADTSEERLSIFKTLRQAYDLYKNNPFEEKTEYDYYYPTLDTLASHMVDVLTQELAEKGATQEEATVLAIKQLTTEGISINYTSAKDVVEKFGKLSDEQLDELISFFKQRENDSNQEELLETLIIFSQIPKSEKGIEFLRGGLKLGSELGNIINSKIVVTSLLEVHGEHAADWVLENIPVSNRNTRDWLLIALIDYAPSDELRTRFIAQAEGNFIHSPDTFSQKKDSTFPFKSYFMYKSQLTFPSKEQERDFFDHYYRGEGRISEAFDDLLARRHPFTTFSYKTQEQLKDSSVMDAGDSGSSHQRFQAQLLLNSEGTLFNLEQPFSQRLEELNGLAPFPSAVKDVYLEMMLGQQLRDLATDAERVELGKKVLGLFTGKSPIRTQLAVPIFRMDITANPGIIKDYDLFMETMSFYLTEPSLSRNYFLNKLEGSISLTPEQLKNITALRLSSEGKKTDDDNAPMTFVANRLGEINREERIKTVLWIMGISSTKPKTAQSAEEEFDGHLDSFPKAVLGSTDDEKQVFFQRLFLGAEGIVDLDAVPEEQRSAAINQRKEFLNALASSLLPDTMPKADLFRDVFVNILESSDASHASRILIKLINRFSEERIAGRQLPPEEVVAIGLNELGVVGKKVAQSLAELDWVPQAYKATLRRSQTEGEVVTKRALFSLASDAGLLDESAPISITSFDDFAGAASNKQAIMLTVDVKEDMPELSKGSHVVVGKFKRPSAQKTENINHDLRVLKGILDVLGREGYGGVLPRDFSAQISDAVNRELDFAQEKVFSQEIREDINTRNSKRRFKISVPTIYSTSDDVMLESVAPGISLRAYKDLREQGYEKLADSEYGGLSERSINQTVVTEALAQLITTGNLHADLHPGNIFVDNQGNLTLIDLGMHEKLSTDERLNTISLITGLAIGNDSYVKTALKNLGWDLGQTALDLRRFNFAENTVRLLRASQRASTSPPELLSSVILATSKLTTYTSGFSNAELLRMLLEAVNRREAPMIAKHLVQSGRRSLR